MNRSQIKSSPYNEYLVWSNLSSIKNNTVLVHKCSFSKSAINLRKWIKSGICILIVFEEQSWPKKQIPINKMSGQWWWKNFLIPFKFIPEYLLRILALSFVLHRPTECFTAQMKGLKHSWVAWFLSSSHSSPSCIILLWAA